MEFDGVLRTSWLCFLLFSFGACFPLQKGQTGAGVYFPGVSGGGADSGYPGGASGSTGSSGFPADSMMDEDIARMWDFLARQGPSRPSGSNWDARHVALGMVETRPLYPSSLIVKTNSGYKRARDFSSDSKYTQDTFEGLPAPQPEDPGTGSKNWPQKTQ